MKTNTTANVVNLLRISVPSHIINVNQETENRQKCHYQII